GGKPAAARTLYEGKMEDVLASPTVFHTRDGNIALAIRAVSFFESEYFLIEKDRVRLLDIPRSADLKGMTGKAMIATLREDYAGKNGEHFAKGALVAFYDGGRPQLLYAPGPRASVETVSPGR